MKREEEGKENKHPACGGGDFFMSGARCGVASCHTGAVRMGSIFFSFTLISVMLFFPPSFFCGGILYNNPWKIITLFAKNAVVVRTGAFSKSGISAEKGWGREDVSRKGIKI